MRASGRRFTVAKNPGRQRARQRILSEANAHRIDPTIPLYRMRHLYRAVSVVRRRKLVKDSVLINAGFNPRRVPQGRPVPSASPPPSPVEADGPGGEAA